LIYLNLHESSIKVLPKSIGKLETLMHLDLSNCRRIHKLPISFRNLKKLEHLDLSKCQRITRVSESLQGLSRLEHLNLSHVSCVGLQQVLLNLTKLRYLNLKQIFLDDVLDAEVGFDSLLECVCSLSNLEYLNLARNCNLHWKTQKAKYTRPLVLQESTEAAR